MERSGLGQPHGPTADPTPGTTLIQARPLSPQPPEATALQHLNDPRPRLRPRSTLTLAAFLAAASLFPAAPAEGQLMQLLKAIGDGGSWISLPVEKGRASLSSPVVPLAGMSIDGCLHVWTGHSGKWTVRAKDTLGDETLDVVAEPGKPVRFDYKAGLRAQLDLNIEWSEPRDTTLFMWIGLARGKKEEEKKDGEEKEGRDICTPAPS